MLTLENITKIYASGAETVTALDGVSLSFRRSEFVSVLGPSGCGKTTLLNVIGGLDSYTSGDLRIRGKSTKQFTDRDWDAYRNHSIGFVFQSYNLIPHQSALANVELAMTISGVSRTKRRERARTALAQVGLGDLLHKRPNQMSGGQMQRVAIARALVNDPEILLADEPTGALDSETSLQIMEILKKISADRLVIMVTHNPELADRYSSRIIRLLDGRILSDSDPYDPSGEAEEAEKRQKKPSVSFLTALSLSRNNLLTKKTRTILTAFAGSIGIIGIALILSLSTGIQNYIDRVQKDTLSSYPITIEEETVDFSGLITAFMTRGEREEHARDAIYSSPVMSGLMDSMRSVEVSSNNLTAFREYLEKEDSPFKEKVSVIQYSYDIPYEIYTRDEDGVLLKSDAAAVMNTGGTARRSMGQSMGFGNMRIWEEMLPGQDGELISPILYDQYDLLYGAWPQTYDEVVLVLNENNELSDLTLYALGLLPQAEIEEMADAFLHDRDFAESAQSFSYADAVGRSFKLILPAEHYSAQPLDGGYVDLTEGENGMELLYDSASAGTEVRIVGVIRENGDASASMLSGSVGYTKALTDHVIEKTNGIGIVCAQLDDPQTDAVNGLPFRDDEEEIPLEEKKEAAQAYLSSLSEEEKAFLYRALVTQPTQDYADKAVEENMAKLDRASIEQMLTAQYAAQLGTDAASVEEYIASMDDETLFSYARQSVEAQVREQYREQAMTALAGMDNAQLASALDAMPLSGEQYGFIYDNLLPPQYSDSSYAKRLSELGYADPAAPSRISLYTTTFESKDAIADLIEQYNAGVEEKDKISYTDYIALLMSSITTIINVISYVLIAFVAISLVVSSIMIGIITYISVLERTKEIGILRAIGASKRDVSRVFNAETLIIGLTAGLIGIGVTMLLNLPISAIVQKLSGISSIRAVLPGGAAAILVAISMGLTLIAGLIPARIASRKDPVVALRTE